MPLVFAAIAPHGWPIIPPLSEDAEGGLATRAALQEMGRRAREAGLEAVAIATPHGFRVEDAIALADVARAMGILHWGGRHVEVNLPVDGALTDAIAAAARGLSVPIAMVGYAGHRRDQSAMPLDWGALVPLWFLGHDANIPGSGDVLAPEPPPLPNGGPPVVLIGPSRSVPRASIVDFGHAIAEAATADPRRIGFIASCDWAHRHAADGPYGFHPAAAAVDAEVLAAVRDNDILRLIGLPDERAAEAAIDGLWQALMLAGAIEGRGFDVDVLSYEAPTYYGMLVATFTPAAATR
ncbi:MAG TPA: aromatic ring-opening dioxygenase subunit LigB [Thermomicrobiales bacterium]|nr:aromatic ring-opening dioxygenase subunit LigB [Thermomicrobiales bacterium]